MRVLDLALKDLTQVARDKKAAVFLLLMPIVFTLFFGLMFRPSDGATDTRARVAYISADADGILSEALYRLIGTSDVVQPVRYEPHQTDEAIDLVRKEELAAAIVIPAAFSERALASGEITSQADEVIVVCDEESTAGHTARRALETSMARLSGCLGGALLGADAYDQAAGAQGEAARREYVEDAMNLAVDAWQRPPLKVVMRAATASNTADGEGASGYEQSSPGMMVQFAIYGLITAATLLVAERKTGTLRRLLTTPITRAEVIGAKTLAMFLMIMVQQVILVALGQWAFGVNYAAAPLAVLLVTTALALWAASLGLFIGVISKGEEQVIMWTLIAMFVFAALGGCWFPLEIVGETFASVGRLLPSGWAMTGLQNIVLRGLGLSSVWLATAAIMGYAILFFGLAVYWMRFE